MINCVHSAFSGKVMLLLTWLCANCWNSASSSDGIYIDNFDVKLPTIHAANNFNITKTTRNLRHAFEGYGTNEKAVIGIMTALDVPQRKLVEAKYKELFKKSLISDIEKELSGSFKSLMLALLEPPEKTMSEHLYNAMKGWGTDEDCLTEILCCHNSDDISRITQEYKNNYKKVLETEVHSETSGKYRELLHLLLTQPRKSDQPTKDSTFTISQSIIRAGFGKSRKVRDSELIKVLSTYSFPQLLQGLHKFKEIVGSNLEESVKNGFSGDFGRALLSLIECTENRPRAYAKRLHEAMGKFRNDDRTLIRIIALRSTIDLEAIRSEYKKLYNESLEKKIKDATSGDLKSGLLALVTGHSSR